MLPRAARPAKTIKPDNRALIPATHRAIATREAIKRWYTVTGRRISVCPNYSVMILRVVRYVRTDSGVTLRGNLNRCRIL